MARDVEPERIERLYAGQAGSHLANWTPSRHFSAAFANTVLKLIDQRPPQRALRIAELGCGHGTWMKVVLQHTAEPGKPRIETMLGIDLTQSQLDLARDYLAAYPQVELICANLLEYQPSASFDLIYVAGVFCHLSKQRQLQVLQAWLPRLAPNGVLIMLDKDRFSLHSLSAELQKRLGRLDVLMWRWHKFPPELRALLQTIGYPDFRFLRRQLADSGRWQVNLERYHEFTALIVRATQTHTQT